MPHTHKSFWCSCLSFGIAIFFASFSHFVFASSGIKTIHTVFEAADDGFDMARTQNYYSGWVADAIFETLLTYDYLARPAKLVPQVAESMPVVMDENKTFIFKIKKHIFFSPDAAFHGKKRELTAMDFAYTIKRLMDPANRSPGAHFIKGKIVGLDKIAEQAKKTGRFDYDAPIQGLSTPDRYILRIQLNRPDPNFLYILAYGAFGAVSQEVVEYYGEKIRQHPVGTGAYLLNQYLPRSKIVLTKNPYYRGFTWQFQASSDPKDKQLIEQMKGKIMPQVQRVEISMIEEEQSRWLAFRQGKVDFDKLPQIAAPNALQNGQLSREFTEQGIRLVRMIEPEITYTIFNFKDPIVGGFSLEKNALRRAIAMSYRINDEIMLLRKGQANKAEMLIPAGVAGHDPHYRSSITYDPKLANQLLDHFAYARGADGYRFLPSGESLIIKMHTSPGASAKVMSEIWKRSLDDIGIRVEFIVSSFADNLKSASQCQLMMWGSAWHADFPDGENFLQLLYGPNAGRGNNGCYQSPPFDALYRQAVALPLGKAREKLFAKMNRQIEADTAWAIHVSRVRNWLVRPWVLGFKKHPILQADWQYIDIDLPLKNAHEKDAQ